MSLLRVSLHSSRPTYMTTFQDSYEPENYKQQIISKMTDLVKDYIRQRHVKWGEEDERIRKDIIRVLKGEIRYISGKENEKYIDWLNPLMANFLRNREKKKKKKHY